MPTIEKIIETFTDSMLFRTAVIIALAAISYVLLKAVGLRIVNTVSKRMRSKWYAIIVKRKVFNRVIAIAPGLIVYTLAGLWLMPETQSADPEAALTIGPQLVHALRVTAHLWVMLFGVLAGYAILDVLCDIYNTLPFAKQMPIRSFVQVIKIAAFTVFVIVGISIIFDSSPTLLISGLGAMTAVVMLIFKDPILGLVAGIQLSANRMLAVGDWLEMPKFSADGDVIDITLTTVKVRNWDQTITTIPTYALISDSFKNWRGMSESGGRRIKRSLFIDMNTVRFLDQADIERLRKAQLLCSYIDDKLADIERSNREQGIDPSSPVNGRRLTNLGTFRAYLSAYLKEHNGIHQGLIMMVRQLQPTAQGLPMEIYAFTSDTGWVAHENVQSDIFDHIMAVIAEFGLRVYQAPAGNDLRNLVANAAEQKAIQPAMLSREAFRSAADDQTKPSIG